MRVAAACVSFESDGRLNVDLAGQLNVKTDPHPLNLVRYLNSTAVLAATLNSAAFNGPYGMAFQNGDSGPLWIMNDHDGTLIEFVPSQIKSSGSPTPKVSLSNASATFATQITFGPVDGKAGDTN